MGKTNTRVFLNVDAGTKNHSMRLKIRCGPVVDRYLNSEGAVAQAVDSRTILLGASVLEMSVPELRRILFHELAHVQQLARPGNDPIRALEDEAWEAADAWCAGKSYRVRGRSRKPLNAVALIQSDEKKKHPHAMPWYRLNPVEPIGNSSTITVKDTVELVDMTLDSVMDAIIQKKDSEVVIVCHGFETELAIPLMKGSALGTIMENVTRLSADRSFPEGGVQTPVIQDKDISNQMSEEQVKVFRAKMNQIRALKLTHVAFRSCDMGRSQDTLAAFRRFFGAASVSAPKIYDAYGTVTPVIGPHVRAWAAAKRKDRYRVWIDRGVAFGVKQMTDSTKFDVVSKAPDKHTFAAWARAHVSEHAGNSLIYHGMQENLQNVADPEAPILYFIRDNDFAANIVFYSG